MCGIIQDRRGRCSSSLYAEDTHPCVFSAALDVAVTLLLLQCKKVSFLMKNDVQLINSPM